MTLATLMIFSNSIVEDGSRLSKLRDELRTDHLNDEMRIPLSKSVKSITTYFTYQETN